MYSGVLSRRRAWAGTAAAVLIGLAALTVVPSASPEQAASKVRRLPAGFLDAGGDHTCAVLAGGTVRCWGYGGDGALGYGNLNDVGDNETPGSVAPVDLGGKAVALAAGSDHTCALLDDGTVRCWGSGAHGALGYGNTNTIGDNETPASVGPVDLGPGRKAVALTAGLSFTCALLDNGTVRCWGLGTDGQLGYANTSDVGDNETPGSVAPVDVGRKRKAVAISAGDAHVCAVLDNGTVRCWGSNTYGQLGYGNTRTIGDDETPGSVAPVYLGAKRKALAISAGARFTCAVLDDATVRCWGSGEHGELGSGNANTIGDDEKPGSVAPVDLGPGRRALAISAGGTHACALLGRKTVRCWGSGADGELGYGNQNDIGDDETPGSVGPVKLIRPAVAISAGAAHTCAALDNGRIRCFGANGHGQLGYGNTRTVGDKKTPASAGPVAAGRLFATRVRPGLSLRLKRRRDRRWPYRLQARGVLSGFPADRATCAGQVTVRATAPHRYARFTWVNLKRTATGCRYAAALTVPRRGTWKVISAFPGNGSLKARTAQPRRFRAG